MSDVVVLDVGEFKELYPSITATDAQVEMNWTIAEGLLNNTKCSVVKDLEQRKFLLYLLVAHITTLNTNVENGNSAVGRVSSASEGSVSISLDYGAMGNNERWYLQTPYGANYWQLTKKYRSFLYRLGKSPMNVRRTYLK